MIDSEQQLVNEITDMLESSSGSVPKDLRRENQLILKEINLGYGIADIVVTQCVDSPDLRDEYLNIGEIKLLKMVNATPGITISKIINKTRNSKRSVTKAIQSLEVLSLVYIEEDKIYPLKSYVRSIKNTIAIETKLQNWKRALKQAYRYKWFSNKSYVCMPSNRVNPAQKNIEMFKRMGVGLISFCEMKGFQILYSPKKQKPISDEMSILLNECVLSELHAS